MKHVYVAGPMRGLPEFNFLAFDRAEERLQDAGLVPFSPAARDRANGFDPAGMDGNEDLAAVGCDLREALAADVKYIAETAEAIIVLPGWERSSGAQAETALARALGLPVYTLDDFLDWAWDGRTEPVNQLDLLRPPAMPDGPFGPVFQPTTFITNTFHTTEAPTEIRVTSATGGAKGQKPRQMGAIDPAALQVLADVAGFGGIKYDRYNYLKGFDWSLSYDAAQRHLMQFWSGVEVDEESGLPHAAHAAWQCLALLSFSLRAIGTDDRPPSI